MTHGSQGFDFLGFHFRYLPSWRNRQRWVARCWPSQRAMKSIRAKVKEVTAPRARLQLPVEDIVSTATSDGVPTAILPSESARTGRLVGHNISGCEPREAGDRDAEPLTSAWRDVALTVLNGARTAADVDDHPVRLADLEEVGHDHWDRGRGLGCRPA